MKQKTYQPELSLDNIIDGLPLEIFYDKENHCLVLNGDIKIKINGSLIVETSEDITINSGDEGKGFKLYLNCKE